ncbi:MAG TPA: PDZ domain-containing protein [Tepidisphaeraceae bacterium]|jgi:hypothetical protein
MWRKSLTFTLVTILTSAATAQQQPGAATAPPATPAAEPAPAALPGAAAQPNPAANAAAAKNDADARQLEDVVRAKVEAERAAAAAERARAVQDRQRAYDRAMLDYHRTAAGGRAGNAQQQQQLQNWLRANQRATRKEKVAYIGVATSETPPVLASQMKLSPGMGLVVDYVVANSPAEKSGIKQYDLITRFDDQLLTNPEQLRTLVRMKKQSDDVKLTILRQGATITVSIELEQQEVDVEVTPEVGLAVPDPNLARNGDVVLWDFTPDGKLNVAPQPPADAFGGGGGVIALANIDGKNQIVWSDAQATLNLDVKDGRAVNMVARDRAGKELFNGPVETDEQRKALPEGLGDKLKKAEAGGPLRFTTVAGNGAVILGAGGGGGGGGGGGVSTAGVGFGGPAIAPPGVVAGNKVYGVGMVPPAAAARARFLTSIEKDILLIARYENGRITYAFAFSQADGKTLFDGPTATEEQRKDLLPDVAAQLATLEQNPKAATEFGVTNRQAGNNGFQAK